MSHVTHMNESRDLYDEGGFVGTRLDFGKDASSHQRLGNRVFAGTQGEKFIVRRCHLYAINHLYVPIFCLQTPAATND